MKKIITILTVFLLSIGVHAQDKTKKTNFQYTKSHIVEKEIKEASDIKEYKAKEFEEDSRTITIKPVDNSVVFDLGFVEKTIDITEESFSLIDKQWMLRLGDANFAFLVIGEDYAIIRLEEDSRTLIMVTENFKFK